MADFKIMCTVINQEFNYDTNKYLTTGFYEKEISVEQYNNMTSKESIEFFKSLGGTEKVTRRYGRVVKLVSTSPSGEFRAIRTFKF